MGTVRMEPPLPMRPKVTPINSPKISPIIVLISNIRLSNLFQRYHFRFLFYNKFQNIKRFHLLPLIIILAILMKVNVSFLESILNAKYFGADLDFEIQDVSIDSRSLINREGVLFFAIKGRFNDAHDFIPKGVKYFVVQYIPEECKEKAQFFVVEDVLKAFQEFAAYYRTLFKFPIIGITGSNGKTIVKEWLGFLLHEKYAVIKSPKSYNSQVGVPLSVIAINQQHNLGIFEAGISTRDEMAVLQSIISPSIGILTNIGTAHNEGFHSIDEKIQEKLKLFSNSNIVLLPNDSRVLNAAKHLNQLVWGFEETCDF